MFHVKHQEDALATPVYAQPTDLLTAAILRRGITSELNTDIKLLFCRIRYTGTVWALATGAASSGLVASNFVWSTNKLVLTLTGYTLFPLVFAKQATVTSALHIEAHGVSASSVEFTFWDMAGAQVTTQSISMDFNCIIIGT